MSGLDAMPARILDALVQLGYIRTRPHPRTGKPEYSFDYEKCMAAAGGHARVPEFLAAARGRVPEAAGRGGCAMSLSTIGPTKTIALKGGCYMTRNLAQLTEALVTQLDEQLRAHLQELARMITQRGRALGLDDEELSEVIEAQLQTVINAIDIPTEDQIVTDLEERARTKDGVSASANSHHPRRQANGR